MNRKSAIYKVPLRINKEKINPVEKLAKDMSRYIIKEEVQKTTKHLKICPISLVLSTHKNVKGTNIKVPFNVY